MDTVQLGTTGIHVSRLCFGTGTHGWNGRSDQTDVGLQEFADLLIYGFEQGITFWDSADQYGSHPHIAQALQTIDRSQVVITSKTCASTAKEAEQDIDRYLREMKTDYIDIVLMHCLTSSDWPTAQAGVMEVLEKKKEQGIIRAHGVSCHDFGAFQQAAITNWVDVVLARINYAGKNMDGPPEKIIPIIEQMDANDIGVYGMKVVACGNLGHDAQNAIHFVLDLPAIDAITIGMKNQQEIDDNIGYIEAHDTALQPV
ncbi:MAG: aldo/keto reductase [Candidatus Latescibacteria bacterium]|jgi:1-deoxyxylulose-5-phosphate synthase|nr:aldo/keto reductase [Candidatus Latescibacterota bacterium]MBT4139526.1 aldo/keto reductase [Candidatus Latescibacterota bacterium]